MKTYNMGYKDGFIEGQREGLEIASDVIKNSPRPITVKIEDVKSIEEFLSIETRELIMIGRCVKVAFDDEVNPLTYMRGCNISINGIKDLIEWGKQQGVE